MGSMWVTQISAGIWAAVLAGAAARIAPAFNALLLNPYRLCSRVGTQPAVQLRVVQHPVPLFLRQEGRAPPGGLGGSVGATPCWGSPPHIPTPHPPPWMPSLRRLLLTLSSPLPSLFPRIPFKIGQPKKQIVPKTVSKAIPRF